METAQVRRPSILVTHNSNSTNNGEYSSRNPRPSLEYGRSDSFYIRRGNRQVSNPGGGTNSGDGRDLIPPTTPHLTQPSSTPSSVGQSQAFYTSIGSGSNSIHQNFTYSPIGTPLPVKGLDESSNVKAFSMNQAPNFQPLKTTGHSINRPSIDLRNFIPERQPVLYRNNDGYSNSDGIPVSNSEVPSMPPYTPSSGYSYTPNTPIYYGHANSSNSFYFERAQPQRNPIPTAYPALNYTTVRVEQPPDPYSGTPIVSRSPAATTQINNGQHPHPHHVNHHHSTITDAHHPRSATPLPTSAQIQSVAAKSMAVTPRAKAEDGDETKTTRSSKKCSPMMSLIIRAKLVLQEIPEYPDEPPIITCNRSKLANVKSNLKKPVHHGLGFRGIPNSFLYPSSSKPPSSYTPLSSTTGESNFDPTKVKFKDDVDVRAFDLEDPYNTYVSELKWKIHEEPDSSTDSDDDLPASDEKSRIIETKVSDHSENSSPIKRYQSPQLHQHLQQPQTDHMQQQHPSNAVPSNISSRTTPCRTTQITSGGEAMTSNEPHKLNSVTTTMATGTSPVASAPKKNTNTVITNTTTMNNKATPIIPQHHSSAHVTGRGIGGGAGGSEDSESSVNTDDLSSDFELSSDDSDSYVVSQSMKPNRHMSSRISNRPSITTTTTDVAKSSTTGGARKSVELSRSMSCRTNTASQEFGSSNNPVIRAPTVPSISNNVVPQSVVRSSIEPGGSLPVDNSSLIYLSNANTTTTTNTTTASGPNPNSSETLWNNVVNAVNHSHFKTDYQREITPVSTAIAASNYYRGVRDDPQSRYSRIAYNTPSYAGQPHSQIGSNPSVGTAQILYDGVQTSYNNESSRSNNHTGSSQIIERGRCISDNRESQTASNKNSNSTRTSEVHSVGTEVHPGGLSPSLSSSINHRKDTNNRQTVNNTSAVDRLLAMTLLAGGGATTQQHHHPSSNQRNCTSKDPLPTKHRKTSVQPISAMITGYDSTNTKAMNNSMIKDDSKRKRRRKDKEKGLQTKQQKHHRSAGKSSVPGS